MESNTVADRIIDQFKLMQVYDVRYRFQARKELEQNVRIAVGKKDGFITVDVDDHDPRRAADIANRYVGELKRMTDRLALTEAQQRRIFFETQLAQTRDRLAAAQRALQSSGFDAGALKAEPKAAADSYASLKAEVTSAEVKLQVLRRSLTDSAPEVQQQLVTLEGLRQQLSKLEASSMKVDGADYVGKYREYKYEEALFDLFSRQYELARLDESREGPLIQVVDPATIPEWKSKPKRAAMAMGSAAACFVALLAFVILRHRWRKAASDPEVAHMLSELRAARKAS
jgi:uncharacterized protein involved in exopolysaccharide biosynthesis